MYGFIAVFGIICATFITGLAMVLRFGIRLVEKTGGKSDCLRDAAVLIKAFLAGSSSGGLLSVLIKLFKRGG